MPQPDELLSLPAGQHLVWLARLVHMHALQAGRKVGFIDVVAMPLFTALAAVFPDIKRSFVRFVSASLICYCAHNHALFPPILHAPMRPASRHKPLPSTNTTKIALAKFVQTRSDGVQLDQQIGGDQMAGQAYKHRQDSPSLQQHGTGLLDLPGAMLAEI